MAVDRCVCMNLTFEHLRSLADEEHLTLAQLQARTHCGTACTLCLPYLRLMMTTGRTSFDPLPMPQQHPDEPPEPATPAAD